MTTFQWLCLIALWGVACAWYGEREGFKRGRKQGFESGWRDCERTLVDLSHREAEVQEEREKIWRQGV